MLTSLCLKAFKSQNLLPRNCSLNTKKVTNLNESIVHSAKFGIKKVNYVYNRIENDKKRKMWTSGELKK